jgi:hypothetical protein
MNDSAATANTGLGDHCAVCCLLIYLALLDDSLVYVVTIGITSTLSWVLLTRYIGYIIGEIKYEGQLRANLMSNFFDLRRV